MNRPTLIAVISAAAAALAAQAVAETPPPKLIGVARAVAAAERVLGAKAFEAELDSDRGGLVYEIDLVKDGRLVEAEVDAVSGKIVRQGHPSALRNPLGDRDLRAAQLAPHALAQTIATVETATKGRVTEIGLERRNGRHYYEVELVGAQDRDILVDIQTGAITPVIDD